VDCEGLQQQERCHSSSLHLFFAMSDEIPPVTKHNNSDQGGKQSSDDIKSFVDFFPSERVKGVCVVVLDVLAV
jgi:hypothetical protein